MFSWQEIVQNYIIKYSNQIGKVTKPLQEHFGIKYFTYHRIDNEGKYTVLVNSPEWAEHYVSKEIYFMDPYLRHPSVYESGISLVDSHGSEEFQDQILKAGKKILSVDMGATLIQKSKDHVEFFGFAGNKETSCLESLYLNHPKLLHSFAAHFKQQLGDILALMEKEAGSLLHLKGKDFLCDQPISTNVSAATRLSYYKDIGMKCEAEKAEKLSVRERECLHLLLEDKSAKEIAARLGLSSRTVEFYFENIKGKLSCWSKQEVIQIAQTFKDVGLL